MKREIYEVYAKVVDANGAYNTLSGYPKIYDSHLYNDDCEKARQRAYGEYYSVLGTMCTRDDRQCQIAMIIRASDGLQIEKAALGKIADIPDPTYTLTVIGGSGSGEYNAYTQISVNADSPEEGKMFDAWIGIEGLSLIIGDVHSPGITFIMPSEAVSLTATYKDVPEPESEPEET